MTYKGFNPVAFARSSATTLAKHITELEESFLKNYQMLALIEGAGRVSYNHGGEGFDWPVQYRTHLVEGNTGETARNFARRNLFKVANLEYRGYQTTDAMYYREFRSNRGPEGIVKVYDNFIDRLTTSIRQGMGPECFVNGYASARSSSWHGLESLFQSSATAYSVTAATGAKQAANQADIVGWPVGSYAGLNLELGYYGGENESGQVWPNGVCDAEYDFWTPLIVFVDTTHADLPSTTNTFAGQGDEALRYGIIHGQRNTNQDGQMTNIMLSRNWYMQMLNLLDSKEQVQVTGEVSLRAFGFKNVFVFDGIEVSWEGAIPGDTGYGFNYNNIELMSMDETLFRPEGPEYDIDTQSFKAVVSTLSNLKFKSPRNFTKWCLYNGMTTNQS
jgi:hypothetical protein